MRPLKLHEQVLTWFCILPPDHTTSKFRRMMYILLAFTTVLCMSGIVLGSIFFIIRYISTDLQNSIYALFQLLDTASFLYSCFVISVSRHQFPSIFEDLAEIYRTNENSEAYQYLMNTDNRCHIILRTYIRAQIIAFFIAALILVGSISLCFFMHGHFDVKFVPPMIWIVLPWDQTTLLGYILKFVFCTLVSQTYLLGNGVFLLLFVAICFNHEAFLEMLQHFIERINRFDGDQNNQDLLNHLVEFHISVKKYFEETANIYSPLLFIHLVGNMLVLASIVFQLDLELQNISFNICVLLAMFTASITNLFIYCYFGMRVTTSFEKMVDSVSDLNWYRLPVRLQKHLIIIIGAMQIPHYYDGFGILYLNLKTFSKETSHIEISVDFNGFASKMNQFRGIPFVSYFHCHTVKSCLDISLIKTVFTYYTMFKAFAE